MAAAARVLADAGGAQSTYPSAAEASASALLARFNAGQGSAGGGASVGSPRAASLEPLQAELVKLQKQQLELQSRKRRREICRFTWVPHE